MNSALPNTENHISSKFEVSLYFEVKVEEIILYTFSNFKALISIIID